MGTILHQYRSDLASCRYIFKSGKAAEFHGHMFRTSNPKEIEELNAEIAAGIGAIMIPPDGPTINSDDIDPVSVFKKKIIAEYEAERARSLDNGSSTSDQGRALPTSTKNVAAVAASSISGAARAITPGAIDKK